jgi:hypothetical protein
MTNPPSRIRVQKELQIGETEFVDFGIADNKGRAIGMKVTKGLHEITIADAQDSSYYIIDSAFGLGTRPAVNVRTTRNGAGYGAGQGWMTFASEENREAYIAKRIAQSRKAYEKKFG